MFHGTFAAIGWFVAMALPLGGAGYLHAAWLALKGSVRQRKNTFVSASRGRRAWPQRVGTAGFIL